MTSAQRARTRDMDPRNMDRAARITVAPDPERHGWLIVTVFRRRPRRMWLTHDEAAILRAQLDKHLPPVTVTRRQP